MIKVYHNARCSKSRECLAFIEETGKSFEVIKYLDTPPTFDELKAIIKKLGILPIELVRKKEPLWQSTFKHTDMSDDDIILAMVNNPILIERPIVINGEKAVIARPATNVDSII